MTDTRAPIPVDHPAPAPPTPGHPTLVQQLRFSVIAGIVGGTLSGVLLGLSATAYWLLQLLFVALTLGGTAQVGARAAFLPSVVSGATFGATVLAVRALTGWNDAVDLGDQPGLLPAVTAVCGATLGALGGMVTARRQRTVHSGAPHQSP